MKSIVVSAFAVVAGLALAPQPARADVVGEYANQCAATLPENLSVPVTAAGHTWVAVGGLDAASLQGLDALVIRYCGTYPGSAAVDAAVAGGMGLVLDSTAVGGNLPGGPSLPFTSWCFQDHSIAPASPIATGPGGTLTNDSLDVGGPGGMGGYCTFTGTTAKATLPSGMIPFVTTADGSRVGALGYNSGAGRVALSMTLFSYPTVYTPSEYLSRCKDLLHQCTDVGFDQAAVCYVHQRGLQGHPADLVQEHLRERADRQGAGYMDPALDWQVPRLAVLRCRLSAIGSATKPAKAGFVVSEMKNQARKGERGN